MTLCNGGISSKEKLNKWEATDDLETGILSFPEEWNVFLKSLGVLWLVNLEEKFCKVESFSD